MENILFILGGLLVTLGFILFSVWRNHCVICNDRSDVHVFKRGKMKLYLRTPAYWFNHVFFTIGLIFVATFLHEFIHHLLSGCDFVAGYYQIEGRTGIGATFCPSSKYGELLAYFVTFLFLLPLMYFKIKIDCEHSPYEKKIK